MSIAAALKRYSREFIMKIHPDRHCGYPEVQEANSSTLNIITQLFQSDDTSKIPSAPLSLRFYLKHSDYPSKSVAVKSIQKTNSHLLISYLLRQESTRSALGLFSLAGIDVDWSLLPEERSAEQIKSPLLDECKNISPDSQLNVLDIQSVKSLLRSHPNIQISPDAPPLPTMKLLFLLQSALIRATVSHNPPPIFIFTSPNEDLDYSHLTRIYKIPSDLQLFPGNL